MRGPRVLGTDACKAGWFGIVLDGGEVKAFFATHITDLVASVEADGKLDVVAVDMPIGLPDRSRRRADELAAKAVGPRRASVFMTPVRTALAHTDHASASAENRRLTGQGISRQAYGLRPKLLQVDEWARQTRRRVVEVHPEVCFAELAAAPLTTRKTTWAGAATRRGLLATAGIVLPEELGTAGEQAAVDDVLDAAVAAWTARRVARGQARCVPDPPQRFSDGLACAIWI
jgi:predicted RNase H-like nuclease